ncbi:MAG: hypothetical protein JWM33_1700 [Caulobacteraceae bacterium]|nr:hypothetical protein [Caulobacteraceae bacterium]
MASEPWQIVRADQGVSLEASVAMASAGAACRWRVRDDLGEILASPDEAAAVAYYSFACRTAILRRRNEADAL